MKRNASNTYSVIKVTMTNYFSGYYCLTSELEETIKFWMSSEHVVNVEVVEAVSTKKQAINLSNEILGLTA